MSQVRQVKSHKTKLSLVKLSVHSYSIPHGICSCLTLGRVVSVQAKHLYDNDVKQFASLLPFIAASEPSILQSDPHKQAMKVVEVIEELIVDLYLLQARCENTKYHKPILKELSN